jgi:transposase
VTDRRSEFDRHYLQPGSPAYKAIKAAIEEQGIRTEEIFDRLEKRMDRLDRDIARSDQGADRLANELLEVRRDLGELRDATHMAANRAAGEAKTAADIVLKTAQKKWWERWHAWAVAFVSIVVFFKNVGPTARGIESFWLYLRESDVRASTKSPEKRAEPK